MREVEITYKSGSKSRIPYQSKRWFLWDFLPDVAACKTVIGLNITGKPATGIEKTRLKQFNREMGGYACLS